MADVRTDRTADAASRSAAAPNIASQRLSAARIRWIGGGVLLVICLLIAGGFLLTPQGSLLVIGPLTLFAMPVLALLADFSTPPPGAKPHPWYVTALLLAAIAVGAVALTVLAQGVVGQIDLVGVFSPDPASAASHFPTFPFTIPLGGLLFVAYLEISIVSGLPQLSAHRVRDGALVFAGCVALALALYLTLANWGSVPAEARTSLGLRDPGGPIDALDLAGIVIAIAIWQVLYLFTGGGPLAAIGVRWARIVLANVLVIGLGLTTFWLLRDVLQASVPQIAELAAMIVVGVLTIGLLFGMPAAGPPGTISARTRLLRFGLLGLIAGLTYFGLRWLGATFQPNWTVGSLELWITICGLNLIGGGIFLYCRILRPTAPTP
jgi:hypothetical protein